MANRNTKRKNAEIADALAKKRDANGDFRFVPPPRKNSKKDFGSYRSFPGFRKAARVAA